MRLGAGFVLGWTRFASLLAIAKALGCRLKGYPGHLTYTGLRLSSQTDVPLNYCYWLARLEAAQPKQPDQA